MNTGFKLKAEPDSPLIQIERVFDTAPDKVFQAFISKELLEEWWSPNGKADIELDACEGGTWRFIDTTPDGQKVIFYGVFHRIAPPTYFVQTGEFENGGEPGHVALEKYEFTKLSGDRTLLTLTQAFLSVQDRDAAVESGMESGLAKSYEHLNQVLKGLE